MTKIKSFRVTPSEMMVLERLQGYMQWNVSRDKICVAALELYKDRVGEGARLDIEGLISPLDACEGIICSLMTESAKTGSTVAMIELRYSNNSVLIPKGTRLKFSPPFSVYFMISRYIMIKLNMSVLLAYNCVDIKTGEGISDIKHKWTGNEKMIIDLLQTDDALNEVSFQPEPTERW